MSGTDIEQMDAHELRKQVKALKSDLAEARELLKEYGEARLGEDTEFNWNARRIAFLNRTGGE